MVDITKQVEHWRDGAREEWQVAGELLEKGRVRHALFFAHLALEKALKAHVCRHTGDLAPRTHNLVRLAEFGARECSPEQLRILAKLNDFSQTGRYPEGVTPVPTSDQARQYVDDAGLVFQWLMTEL
jgi:HEPN domain-containing protein